MSYRLLELVMKSVPPATVPLFALPVVVAECGAPTWWLAFAGVLLIAQGGLGGSTPARAR
ncbi:MAG: hypothetical protein WAV90_14920 [Gordonia amarae]